VSTSFLKRGKSHDLIGGVREKRGGEQGCGRDQKCGGAGLNPPNPRREGRGGGGYAVAKETGPEILTGEVMTPGQVEKYRNFEDVGYLLSDLPEKGEEGKSRSGRPSSERRCGKAGRGGPAKRARKGELGNGIKGRLLISEQWGEERNRALICVGR